MACKIVPRILGGLGNQLFCYAAARRLALKNHAELVLDDVSGFERDMYQRHYQLEHFNITCRKATPNERLAPFSTLRRRVKRFANQYRPLKNRQYIQQVGVDFDAEILNLVPTGTVHIEGYWQSEQYFKDVEATIRDDLKITPPTDTLNLDMAGRIQNCVAVAVHVRFFDTPEVTDGNNAPSDYYGRAIAKMETLVPGAHYFLFSDRPEAARARVALPDNRVTCVAHNQGDANAYADLWLMTLCQHFIIANSTFSWWGAWLADSPHKHIIAPGFEIREGSAWWGFDGLLPASWIKL